MIDLAITCTGVTAPTDVAVPTLRFGLDVQQRGTASSISILALKCQIRIEPSRRDYDDTEGSRLHEMFGAPDRWRDNLHPMQFAQVSLVAPGFTGATHMDVDVGVTYDFEVSTAKYFDALSDGEVPFILLFSGSAYAVVDGRLQVSPVSWSAEARVRMPIAVWRHAMDIFFPATTYVRVERTTLAALQRFKVAKALPGWDATVMALLAEVSAHDA